MEANRRAADMFKELSKAFPCDYEEKPNFVYLRSDRKKLETEAEVVRRLGFAAEIEEELPLPFPTVGAVKFPNQAQFNPAKFFSQLAKELNIYEKTFVRELAPNTAVTGSGTIKADKIIVAAHFPILNKHGGYFLKMYQSRSYVIALENAPLYEGMYVDGKGNGLSFRNYGDLLLLGGGGHRTGKKGSCWRALRDFADKHYPDSKEKYHWAAQDCMSLDGVPYIGAYSSGTTALYTASGFNKWGMTSSMAAAMLLSDIAIGTGNKYAGLFDPSRSILRPQLFVNAGEAALNLIGFSKKRCPHMGCRLRWNKWEHSWDCACHGSRFSEDGTLLDNPSTGNI
ncbi:MAG: FAD-dependent oxidoreductase [Bacteroides sp.]|nr:FAD-dependent oxidoreductase [Bacteroides sp.]